MSPTLADLLQDPQRVAEVAAETVAGLLGELERLRAALWARMMHARSEQNGRTEAPPQRRTPQPAPTEQPEPDSRTGHEPLPEARPVARISLLSVKEAARMLSCSEAAVRRWSSRRQLPVVKLGRLTRFHFADVEALIARGSRPARADRR